MNKFYCVLSFIFFSLFIFTPDGFPVPANPNPVEVRQPDGTKIKIKVRGDEFYGWYEDTNGYTILKDTSTKNWTYAEKGVYGNLRPSGNVVGKVLPSAIGVKKSLMDDERLSESRANVKDFNLRLKKILTDNAVKYQKANSESDSQGSSADSQSQSSSISPVSGTKTNLVVLVQFSDLKFRDNPPFSSSSTDEEIIQAFDNLFNKTNYTTDGAVGSVKDYFNEVSYGKIVYNSVITPIVTLDESYVYYGYNNGFNVAREMVKKALSKLSAAGYNFKDVWPDATEPEGFTVIHAGGGAESGNWNFIWSHQWSLYPTVTYNGIEFSSYHTEPAGRGYYGSDGLIRIGVICHESTHFFGIPDLYDTVGSSEGLGNFCLMASGNWNGDSGSRPAHPCAWIKYKLGWGVPQTASIGSNSIGVSASEETAFLKFTGSAFDSREYFLMENRQYVGFDKGLPGYNTGQRGLLIYHIDERQSGNDDSSHYLVDIEEADGSAVWENDHLAKGENSGLSSDYYRSNTVTVFNDDCTSTPNSQSYTYQASGIKISQISASGSEMTFSYGKDVVVIDDFSKVAVFPNPARNGTVTITNLPTNSDELSIEIFTMTAQLVKSFSIDDTEFTSEGIRKLKWDCKNESGSNVAPGVYMALLKTQSHKKVIKIAVIR